MQFFEPTTNYSLMHKILKFKLGDKLLQDPMAWYPLYMKFDAEHAKKLNQENQRAHRNSDSISFSEMTWYGFGKPYYKVFPAMADAMSEVSIDIPAGQLQLPYPAFQILLPNSPLNTFREPNGPVCRSILCSEIRCENRDNDFRSFKRLASGADRAFLLVYTFDVIENGMPVICNFVTSLHNAAGTIDQFFNTSYERTSDMPTGPGNWMPGRDLVYRIIRLAVATCFFGIDRHELVMPDLPRRKIERRASQKGISLSESLKELSREINDTKMWTIGHEIALPAPEYVKRPTDGSDPERHELTYAHMRRGHMRWQKVGEGRKDRKLVFVHPSIVRPDLPWATSRGYRIPDENLQEIQ